MDLIHELSGLWEQTVAGTVLPWNTAHPQYSLSDQQHLPVAKVAICSSNGRHRLREVTKVVLGSTFLRFTEVHKVPLFSGFIDLLYSTSKYALYVAKNIVTYVYIMVLCNIWKQHHLNIPSWYHETSEFKECGFQQN